MKKKIVSALLTLVMVVTMLTAMCPGVLATQIEVPQPVKLEVGKTYTNEVLGTITKDTDVALNETTFSANGITITATVSEDKKSIALSYSGTLEANEGFEIPVIYYNGIDIENPQKYYVTFTVKQPKVEVEVPVISSYEPASLEFTNKQTDDVVKFTVSATGNGTIVYCWYVDGAKVLEGEKDSSFTLVPEDMTIDKHYIVCEIINKVQDGDTIISKSISKEWAVTIEEGDAPKITGEPTSGKIDGTGSASFTVNATGEDLKYQWFMISGSKKEKVVDGAYGAIVYSGATTSTLTVKCTMAPKDASTKFICEVTSGSGLMTPTGEYSLKITEDPNAGKVQKIEIVRGPSKTSYIVGETLDEEGLKIKVTTGKDEEEITTGFVCSPAYLDEEGTQTITVSYGGKTTTFTVTVDKAPHEHEWSEWKVDNSTPVKVYRECVGGDDCTAKESLSKDTFMIQYPTIAAELGLTKDDNTETETDSEPEVDVPVENEPTEETEDNETNEKDDNKKDDKKKNGNGVLWAIIIIALILLAAVICYYFLVYRKPYKKPTNNNKK